MEYYLQSDSLVEHPAGLESLVGGLKPHHSCRRDDSQVWQPAGLESSVGGLKQNHTVSKMIHWFGIPQGWRAQWDVWNHIILSITYPLPKPNHIIMTSNTRYCIISSDIASYPLQIILLAKWFGGVRPKGDFCLNWNELTTDDKTKHRHTDKK